MGRHSAPDESEVEATEGSDGTAGTGTSVALDLGAGQGRHSLGAEVDDTHTQRIAVITDAPIEDRHDTDVIVPVEAPPVAEPGAEPAAESDTKARKAQEKARAKAEKADRAAQKTAAKAEAKTATKATDKTSLQGDKAAAKADRKAKRSQTGTRADLRMLRQNGAVRAQALAAVIVSFLLYTVVMVVIGAGGSYLQWLWIPIVASGVLVGVVLDLAHRRAAKSTDQPSR
jgi:hypothetical protein